MSLPAFLSALAQEKPRPSEEPIPVEKALTGIHAAAFTGELSFFFLDGRLKVIAVPRESQWRIR